MPKAESEDRCVYVGGQGYEIVGKCWGRFTGQNSLMRVFAVKLFKPMSEERWWSKNRGKLKTSKAVQFIHMTSFRLDCGSGSLSGWGEERMIVEIGAKDPRGWRPRRDMPRNGEIPGKEGVSQGEGEGWSQKDEE